MDDAARGNRGRLAASWTQILVLLGSGVILLPGLCFAVGNSSHGYNALPAILVLTFGAGRMHPGRWSPFRRANHTRSPGAARDGASGATDT